MIDLSLARDMLRSIDASFLRQKYDPSAETDPIKTSASFTEAGVDQMENLDGLMKLLGI